MISLSEARLLTPKVTRADLWLDPLCCRDAQNWLETQKSCAVAWSHCFHPGFLCWYLDFIQQRFPEFFSGPMKPYFQKPWRMTLYRDFMHYQLSMPAWLVSFFMWWFEKDRDLARFAFWVVTGYFDEQRDRRPGYWWSYTALDIKNLHPGAEFFLSEES